MARSLRPRILAATEGGVAFATRSIGVSDIFGPFEEYVWKVRQAFWQFCVPWCSPPEFRLRQPAGGKPAGYVLQA